MQPFSSSRQAVILADCMKGNMAGTLQGSSASFSASCFHRRPLLLPKTKGHAAKLGLGCRRLRQNLQKGNLDRSGLEAGGKVACQREYQERLMRRARFAMIAHWWIYFA